jgi:hypothetical protein
MAKELIRKSSMKDKIANAKRLLVCINRGSGGKVSIGVIVTGF